MVDSANLENKGWMPKFQILLVCTGVPFKMVSLPCNVASSCDLERRSTWRQDQLHPQCLEDCALCSTTADTCTWRGYNLLSPIRRMKGCDCGCSVSTTYEQLKQSFLEEWKRQAYMETACKHFEDILMCTIFLCLYTHDISSNFVSYIY